MHLAPALAANAAPTGAAAAFGWTLCGLAFGVAIVIAALALRARSRERAGADATVATDPQAASGVASAVTAAPAHRRPARPVPVRHLPVSQPAAERRAPVTLAG